MKQSFNNNKKYSGVHGIIIKSENCFDASLLIQAVLILILKPFRQVRHKTIALFSKYLII